MRLPLAMHIPYEKPWYKTHCFHRGRKSGVIWKGQAAACKAVLAYSASGGRIPQSKDYRVKPHCIKPTTTQKLRSRRIGSSRAEPCHCLLGALGGSLHYHHPPLPGSWREGDIIMQMSPPGNPLCFQIPIPSLAEN